MNALTIKDSADLLSFIGHALGFWPNESLVCITLDKGKVGATLRIDLPPQPGTELSYARTVSSFLTSDKARNTQHRSSPPSATSTGGKAEDPKHTNTCNSPSTPTPPTASPDSPTKCSEPASAPAGTPTKTPPTKPNTRPDLRTRSIHLSGAKLRPASPFSPSTE